LLGARHGDDRPNARPAGEEQRQGREPLDLPADRLEGYISVEHRVGRLQVTARIEVHQQKGEVIENIDRRQCLAELQRVKGNRVAVDEHDVAKVQIAVTAADARRVAALD
jgi:hypothetical protein